MRCSLASAARLEVLSSLPQKKTHAVDVQFKDTNESFPVRLQQLYTTNI